VEGAASLLHREPNVEAEAPYAFRPRRLGGITPQFREARGGEAGGGRFVAAIAPMLTRDEYRMP
jgi:hypothetical protein